MDNMPALEPRFLPPAGWNWHYFENPRGQRLRFGIVLPAGQRPRAIVIGLQGLSEFTEKYFETAHDILARGLGFAMLDWRGHGKSDRLLANPHLRHSDGFDRDILDLQDLITRQIDPLLRDRYGDMPPLIMLAHSMGGNIGLRYLQQYPGVFAAAAFSAPMVGIYAVRNLPAPLLLGILGFMKFLMGEKYVFGGSNWRPDWREKNQHTPLSHDPTRHAIHNAWCRSDRALQVGNITFGWLFEALYSCYRLLRNRVKSPIDIPVLFALAGEEYLVNNEKTRHFAARLSQATIIELPDAAHEILMERDAPRDTFFAAFDALITAALSVPTIPVRSKS